MGEDALIVAIQHWFSLKALFKFSLMVLVLHAVVAPAVITVTKIAAGSTASHSLFLKSDGSLWGMGLNTSGQLGDGTFNGYNWGYNQTNIPQKIVASNVVAIAAGSRHSLFLKSDGSLWGMGNNGDGQLGISTNYWTNKPVKIVARGVTAIAAGDVHSLFLKSDGSLWAMGYNYYGQLGDGTFSDSNRPEEIIDRDGVAIATKQSHGRHSPIRPRRSRVTDIAAGGAFLGYGHSLFLKSDGSLWAMGSNQYGQLGDGTTDSWNYLTNQPVEIVASNVMAVAAGGVHSLFLKSDGSLWAMGYNYPGQLGTGSLFGTNRPAEIVVSNVVAVAAGSIHSLFLKSDGSLWGMGRNHEGELGDGFWDDGPPGGTTWPEQIWPRPQPILTQAISSSTNLEITATCGFGGNFYLLANNNLSQPLNQWTPVATNIIYYRWHNLFSATLTNAINSGSQQFYILQSPYSVPQYP